MSKKGERESKSERAFYRMERNQKHTLNAAGIFERTFQGKNSTLWGSYKKRKTLQIREAHLVMNTSYKVGDGGVISSMELQALSFCKEFFWTILL